MVSVAVTGVSGRAGQRLLRVLDDDDAVERVVGLDVREPRYRPRSLDFHAVDVGTADLKPLLEGVDVLVHLAARFEPEPDEQVMERVNVEGTRRVLDAAAATGVPKTVLISSAAAYGAREGNPVPLTEDVAIRPNTGYAFAAQKAEAERILADWRDEHPGVTTVVLRPAFVLGEDTAPSVRALVLGRLPFRARGGTPEAQYVHLDDLVSAVHLAITGDLSGVYNVAADGWMSHEEAGAIAGHTPRVSVSADVAERMTARLWRAGVVDLPPGMVPFLVHPCVVANDRLRAAGWEPRHSNAEAVLACVEGEEGAGGGRAKIVLAGTAALTGAAAAAATWWWRRR